MIAWIILIIVGALSIFIPWLWIGFIILGAWNIQRMCYLYGTPWRRVHFPMMRNYAAICGVESIKAESSNGDFDFNNALKSLLLSVYPESTDQYLTDKVKKAFNSVRTYSDMPGIAKYIKDKNPKTTDEEINLSIEDAKEDVTETNKFYVVCTVIAGVIEEKYSSNDRHEYLFEVLSGNAK